MKNQELLGHLAELLTVIADQMEVDFDKVDNIPGLYDAWENASQTIYQHLHPGTTETNADIIEPEVINWAKANYPKY